MATQDERAEALKLYAQMKADNESASSLYQYGDRRAAERFKVSILSGALSKMRDLLFDNGILGRRGR
jgi:hypothetical protein